MPQSLLWLRQVVNSGTVITSFGIVLIARLVLVVVEFVGAVVISSQPAESTPGQRRAELAQKGNEVSALSP
jgi:hypothetical protein